MKKHLLIICICIVLLFIPVSSAVDVNTNVDSEPIENPEIEPLDNKGYDYDYILIEGTYDYLEKKAFSFVGMYISEQGHLIHIFR